MDIFVHSSWDDISCKILPFWFNMKQNWPCDHYSHPQCIEQTPPREEESRASEQESEVGRTSVKSSLISSKVQKLAKPISRWNDNPTSQVWWGTELV